MRMRNVLAGLGVLLVASAAFGQQPAAAPAMIDLAGDWRFAMDRNDAGVNEKWFARPLADKIKLPGILQAQGYGDDISINTPWVAALPRDMKWFNLPQYAPYTKPGNVKMPYLSQPPKHYLGVAWYQRDIEIPAAWAGKVEHLFLERAHWETDAYIDDKKIGMNNSIVAPHEFEAGALSPGRHTLSIRVDNQMSVVPGYRPDGHGVSDALGGAWNGVAGRMELRATSPVWIDDVQVFPNVAKKTAHFMVKIGNSTGKAGEGKLSVSLIQANAAAPKAIDLPMSISIPGSLPAVGLDEALSRIPPLASAQIKWDANGGQAELDVPLASAKNWDEFNPVLQVLMTQLTVGDGYERKMMMVGLREISHNGRQLLLNGHEINLRMTHFGGDFPLTGYPATDVASWKKIIQTCKDFGLNGIRFHSWCPPEAAFTAADQLGFYLQPEAGMWNSFNPAMVEMLNAETARMERAYGNHPSYIMLSPSNEPAGNYATLLPAWAGRWNSEDPRRLYSGGTGRSGNSPNYTYGTAVSRGPNGWFGRDYGNVNQNIPMVAHEVGQWCVYPDFDVIKKFTGYLQPGNYDIWRDFAAEHGVLGNNKALAMASGKFQVQCYKQEIEANLRTPGLSGIQLLDLHDYLGQGGALIGVLDTFWETKGYVTADEFRRFCAPVVPLARMRNYVYRAGDAFEIPVEITNYSEQPIVKGSPYWKIVDLSGKAVAQGTLAARDIPIGKNISLGTVTADLSKLDAPREYKLVVGLANTKTENDWNFWLYPAPTQANDPADVLITANWTEALARLGAGGKVLFTPPANMLDNSCPPMANRPIFWNRVMNNANGNLSQIGFLGLLVDAKSPALAAFPTEDHCDWQWTDIVNGVRAINIENVPQLVPVVQAIDDWNRDFKLGVIFECNVGQGKLLVSAINLQGNLQSSVARQLRASLLSYAGGDGFKPKVTLSTDQANALWPATRPPGYKAPAMPGVSTMPGANPGDVVEPGGAGPGPR